MVAKTKSEPETGGMERSDISPVDQQGLDTRKPATRVKAGALLAALKDVNEIVQARSTVPILQNVLFEAEGGTIRLTGTDLDRWAVRSLASDDRDGPASADWIKGIRGFVTTLPAEPLQKIVAEFDSEAMVTIEKIDNRAKISCGKSTFRLSTLPIEDFPQVPSVEIHASFDMACSALADALAAVDHAVSSEETRYYLNGVFVHPDVEALDLRFAATNGNQLARVRVEPPEGALGFPAAIVSRQTVAALQKLLAAAPDESEVAIEASDSGHMLSFELPARGGGDVRLVAKAIDGTFPDYVRVIPTHPEQTARIGRAALAEAVKRVSVLATKESRCVKAVFTRDLLTLSVVNPDFGDAVEEVACAYAGPDLAIGFNNQFLRDELLALAADEVALGFTTPDGPVRLRAVEGADGSESDRLVQVIMPMRV